MVADKNQGTLARITVSAGERAAAEALSVIERGHSLATKIGSGDELARTQFALARALIAARVDRRRALELARQARTFFADSNGPFAREIETEIESWIESRIESVTSR